MFDRRPAKFVLEVITLGNRSAALNVALYKGKQDLMSQTNFRVA